MVNSSKSELSGKLWQKSLLLLSRVYCKEKNINFLKHILSLTTQQTRKKNTFDKKKNASYYEIMKEINGVNHKISLTRLTLLKNIINQTIYLFLDEKKREINLESPKELMDVVILEPWIDCPHLPKKKARWATHNNKKNVAKKWDDKSLWRRRYFSGDKNNK